jgi:peptidoglycan/xylan/chitin deacetylase (PgdA/CDA1 family)
MFTAPRRRRENQPGARRSGRRRSWLGYFSLLSGTALVCLLLLLTQKQGRAASVATAGPPRTIVSLTFDDGWASEYAARAMLAAHRMHATFYVNSPRIGTDGHMTWRQINELSADGNEIAGHSAYHPVLTQLDPREAKRQVCYDRDELLRRGFRVTDFAYPFGAYNAALKMIVKGCGYNSARTTDSFGTACSPCAERSSAKDLYATRVIAFGSDPVRMIESKITKAEQAGGWAQLVFHEVCDGCGPNAIAPRDLRSLLDWLRPRSTIGTVVKTVQQVVGGAVRAAVPGPALPSPPSGTNAIRNASLEQDGNSDLVPDCFFTDSWGKQTFRWTRTRDAHTGRFAERLDVTHYRNGDNKLMQVKDLGVCATTVSAGRRYTMSAWYKSSAPIYFAVFSRDTGWAWSYWTSSPSFPTNSSWTRASWTTPAIPRSLNGLSFGLSLAQNGRMTIDDVTVRQR